MRTLPLLAAAGLLLSVGTASARAPHVVARASGTTPKLAIGGLKPIANVSARATVRHPAAIFLRIVASHPQKADVLLSVLCDTGQSSYMKSKNVSIATGALVPVSIPAPTPDSCLVIADSVIRKGGSETVQILAS
jgi:hypothetical protein